MNLRQQQLYLKHSGFYPGTFLGGEGTSPNFKKFLQEVLAR